MNRARLSYSLTVVALWALGGCADVIMDDFGDSGYARVQGIVTQASGAPLANSGVFITCGTEVPGTFGLTAPVNATGAFDVAVDAPRSVALASDGTLQCRLAAPTGGPAIATAELAIPFSLARADRPLTVVNLTEP